MSLLCSETSGLLLYVSRLWIGHGFGVQRASSFEGSEVCFGLISAYDKAMSRKVCVFLG